MITEREVYELIEIDNMPYWWLNWKASEFDEFKNFGSYSGEGLPDNASVKEKVKHSINALKSRLEIHRRTGCNYIYSITISESKTSSSTKRQEHFFRLQHSQANPQPNTMNGLAGMEQSVLGMIEKQHEFQIQSLEKQKEYEINTLRMQNEFQLERLKLQHERELNQREESKFTAENLNTVLQSGANLLGQLFAAYNATKSGAPIAGTPAPEPEPMTEKEKAVMDLAEFIDENTLSVDEINILKNTFTRIIQLKHQNHESERETTEQKATSANAMQ